MDSRLEPALGDLASSRLAAIVESSDDAIIAKDLNGIITDWNQGAETIFGYTAAEMVGTPIMRLIPEDRQAEEAYLLEQIRRGQRVDHFETVRRTKDGRLIDVSVTASPIRDASGTIVGASKSARDITRSRRLEEALHASEDRLRAFIKHAPAAVAMFDQDMRYLQASDRWLADYHLEGDRIIGQSHYDVFPDAPERWKDAHQRVLAGSIEGEAEDVFHRADGHVEWLEWEARPWHRSDGVIGGLMIFTQFITERKRSELRIQHLNRVYAVRSDINQAITREKDTRALLERVCRVAVETGQFLMAWIGMLDATRRVLTPVAAAGAVEGYLDGFEIDRDDQSRITGPCGRCLSTGQHAVCNDTRRDPLYASWRDDALQRGYQSSACFPLKVDGQVIGVINLYASEPDFFDARELSLLDELALDIGFALEVHQRESDRQRAEQALRSSERQFASAFEYASIGKAIVSLDGHWLKVNQALCAITGYTMAELYGSTFQDITHPDDVQGDNEIIEDLLAGRVEMAQREKRYIHKDGHVVWILLSVSLVRDDHGEPVHFIAQIQDITERRRAETSLRESEERFRQVAENIQEVFWMTQVGTPRVLYVSPAYEKIWGRTRASLYESPPSWLESLHPDDRERVREAIGRQAEGGYNETYRIVRPDGSVRWIHDRAFPVKEPDGSIDRIVGTAEDITERRQLEEQFRQAQKLEGIGQLASGVAHDFNNILAAMIMQVELMRTADNLPDELREGLHQIRTSADRAASLTRQLLLFSRKQMLQPRDLNLNDVVGNIATMLQRIVGEDLHVQLDLSSQKLMTRADPGMLDQVLLNLVVNARDAMPAGGDLVIATGVVTLDEREAGRIAEAVPGTYACLQVTDNGTGIAPEDLDRIFEPFFTTKGPGKGTGLGLATVFGIVKQHGGAIRVTSQPGNGTTFRVLLPALPPDVVPADAQLTRSRLPGGSETVLLVEDDAPVRRLARRTLERAGYHVLEASTGVEALGVWAEQQESIALLLTDVVMPEGVRGLDLAAQLRTGAPQLKVVFTSGYSAEIARGDLAQHEGHEFLQKPFSPRQLLETVRRALDR
jgi:PAS domain S-box-containing protein